jgi:hypothetical protein
MKVSKEQMKSMMDEKVSQWIQSGNKIKKCPMKYQDAIDLNKKKGSTILKEANEKVGINLVVSGE